MRNALQKFDSKVVRGRPKKALRQNSRHAENLIAYPSDASREFLERSTLQNSVKPEISNGTSVDLGKFDSRPFVKTAASNDTAVEGSTTWLSSVPRKQFTLVLVGCLFAGALVGHQWSILTVRPQFFANAVTATPVAAQVVSENPNEVIVPIALLPATTDTVSPLASGSVYPEPQYAERENEYLSEIDWLKNQTNKLQFEVDELSEETFDQNLEILELELKIVALRSQSEPSTETRIVYNFINVPIGMATDAPYNEREDYVDTQDGLYDEAVFVEPAYDTTAVVYDNEALLPEWELRSTSDLNPGESVYDPATGNYFYPNRTD